MREPPRPGTPAPPDRPAATLSQQDRLKAALKANMGRRKAQAKARSAKGSAGEDKGK